MAEGYRASPAQIRAWQVSARGGAPWIQVVVDAHCDAARLPAMADALVARHEALRTRLAGFPGIRFPLQVIDEATSPPLAVARDEAAFADALARRRGASAPGLDGVAIDALAGADGRALRLALTASQATADAASLAALADALAHGELGPEPDSQHVDFSEWLADGFEHAEHAERRRFWTERAQLPAIGLGCAAGSEAALPWVPSTAPVAAIPVAALEALGERWDDALLAAWLHDLSARGAASEPAQPVRIDRVVSLRGLGELASVVGPLELRVPTRAVLALPVRELARAVATERALAEAQLDAFDLPFDDDPQPSIVFEPIADGRCRRAPEPALLWLRAWRDGALVQLELLHDPVAIPAGYARVLAAALAAACTDAGELRHGAGPALCDAERAWLTAAGDGGPTGDTGDPIARIAAHVARAPGAPAISWRGETLSYASMWEQTARVAAALSRRGIQRGARVALLLDRGPDALLALLGVLRADAAFVPLDLACPTERLAELLADAEVDLVVLDARAAELHAELAEGPRAVRCGELLAEPATGEPATSATPADLAYLIFTSGSTGRPKAVAIRRGGIVELAAGLRRDAYAGAPGGLRITVNAPLAFDASLKQIAMLCHGDTLCPIPEDERRELERLLAYVAAHHIDVLDCTPPQLRLLLDAAVRTAIPLPPRILVGGDVVDPVLWQRLAALPATAVVNVYGPTEITGVATCSPIRGDLAPGIGRPLPGMVLRVTDDAGALVPIGAPGELRLGGTRVAHGYYRRPALTAERFTPDGHAPGDRAYRSGDRVCWLPDGRLGFLGRADHQVKVRGHRVELGEIEAALAAHPATRAAAVIARPAPEHATEVIAYVAVAQPIAARGELRPDRIPLAEQNRIETDYLYDEIFVKQVYGRHGLELPPDAVVLDVGANIGMFSLWIAHTFPTARVWAFEPIPALIAHLRANLGHLAPRIGVVPVGLGANEATTELTFYPNYSMMSGAADVADPAAERAVIRRNLENERDLGLAGRAEALANLDVLLEDRFAIEPVHARIRPLSDVLRELAVDRIDLLKIDVQRAEVAVLDGIDGADWDRVQRVVMEVHDAPGTATQGRTEDLLERFEAAGFEVTIEQDPALAGTDRYVLYAWRPAATRATTARASSIDERGLRQWLSERLPEYMIPHRIVLIDALPVTSRGKIDRAQLAELASVEQTRAHVAPSSELEVRLASVWAEVLRRPRVGAGDSFFDLGGDSISGIRVQVKARERGIIFDLQDLFRQPDLRSLARHARLAAATGTRLETEVQRRPFAELAVEHAAALPPGVEDAYPAPSAQLGMLFHIERAADPRVYHNATRLRLAAAWRPEALQRAWAEVVARHPILRSGFVLASPAGPLQCVWRTVDTTVAAEDWSALDLETRELCAERALRHELATPFDLAHPPLVRLRLDRLTADEVQITVAELHAVLDGLSLHLLIRELLARYAEHVATGHGEPRPALRCTPADAAALDHAAARDPAALERWRRELVGAPPLALPVATLAERGATVLKRRRLPAALLRDARACAQRCGVHVKHVLLAAFTRALGEWLGAPDVVTGIVVHGRPERADGDVVLGMFLHTIPLRARVDGAGEGRTWGRLIRDVYDTELRILPDRRTPLAALRCATGDAAVPGCFFNFVAFEGEGEADAGPVPPARREIGVDVDYPLAVDFELARGGLELVVQYRPGELAPDEVAAFGAVLLRTLEHAAGDPARALDPIARRVAPLTAPPAATPTAGLAAPDADPTLEREVAAVFAEVLGTSGVHRTTAFAELGGHSLLALAAVSRLRERTGVPLPLAAFLAAPTVAHVTAAIAALRAARPHAAGAHHHVEPPVRVFAEDSAP